MYREVLFSEREPEVGSKRVITYNNDGKPGIYDRKKNGDYVKKYQQGDSDSLYFWLELVPAPETKEAESVGQSRDRGVNLRMSDSLNDVRDFHQAMGHPVLQIPTIPTADRTDLRVELLQEELNELKTAIETKNIVEIADALCDLQFVLSGAVLEFGLGEKFKELFEEVQRSNMSKACATQEEAEETHQHYKEQGVDTYFRPVGNVFVVYRLSDHKIMKNKYYSAADLKSKLL